MAARAVGVDAEVLLVDLHLDVLRELRPHEHGRKRGVPAGGLVEGGDPNEPMHAGFSRHQAVGVVAGEGEGRALEARLVAGLVVDHLAPEPAALRPAQVHAQQHVGPVLRLGPPGARVDGHDRTLLIVLAPQDPLGLGRLHLGGERVERPGQFPGDVLALLRPLHQHREVVLAAPERLLQLEVLFETPAPLEDLLGLLGVLPEIGRSDATVDRLELARGM
jgi:hypothetical protein